MSPLRCAAARRDLVLVLLLPAVAALPGAAVAAADGFSYGVSAGDVTAESAILWTRADEPGPVTLELFADAELQQPLVQFTTGAEPAADQTVKLDVSGLSPRSRYYYRFALADGRTSDSGTFVTAPQAGDAAPLRFVFTGDSNFRVAPFVAFAAVAAEPADLLIWFGDTIYADVTAEGLGPARTLADYRAKYQQVRGDPHVQAAAAAMAVLPGWDDHEVFNDYAGRDPAVSAEQRDSGYRAFFEYMPVRPAPEAGDAFRTYRSFRYGANVEFFLLDGRQYRDPSALEACGGNLDPQGFLLGPLARDGACVAQLEAPRSMLGAAQLEWLKRGLQESTAAVKFIINNVPMTYLGVFPYDRWDGYDAERRELLRFIADNNIAGVVILTTDIHANAFNPDVNAYFRRFRPDYGLRSPLPLPELIVGPIGNATARQSVDDVVEGLIGGRGVGPLADFGQGVFVNHITQANGLKFVEANQLSYVVVDVSEGGAVSFTYRGVTPEAVAAGQTAVSDFYADELRDNLPVCGGGLLFPLLGLCGLVTLRRRGR